MERLKRWFGGEGSGQQQAEQNTVKETNPLVLGIPVVPDLGDRNVPTVTSPKVPVSPAPRPQTTPPPLLADIHLDASVTETRMGQLMNQGREMVLKVVPLAEGDCLSCKLISCGVVWAAAAYVVLSIKKGKARYTGYKRTLYSAQALSLSTALTLIGVARFFDMSVFAAPDQDGKKKGLTELLQDDMNSFHRVLFRSSSPSPTINSENKTDS